MTNVSAGAKKGSRSAVKAGKKTVAAEEHLITVYIMGKAYEVPAKATIMGAIGMLSGFCGTLTTPMAANFNIVPAALLELPDRNAVIKAQVPTAIPLLLGNIILMYVLVFRF